MSLNIKLIDVGAAFEVEGNAWLYVMMMSNDLTFPPKLHRHQPKWLSEVTTLDRTLSRLLWEIYASLNMHCLTLAAMGLRTIFDKASELLGINTAMPFVQKLDQLLNDGWIGQTERELLGVLVDAGSAAAHRGWQPTNDDLGLLFDVMEPFLQRAFLTKDRVRKMAQKVPQKPPRKTSNSN